MARKKDWTYWSNGLHQASTGLADITELAQARGVDRSVIDREILIAWSEARHGQTSAYGGVLLCVVFSSWLLRGPRPACNCNLTDC